MGACAASEDALIAMQRPSSAVKRVLRIKVFSWLVFGVKVRAEKARQGMCFIRKYAFFVHKRQYTTSLRQCYRKYLGKKTMEMSIDSDRPSTAFYRFADWRKEAERPVL